MKISIPALLLTLLVELTFMPFAHAGYYGGIYIDFYDINSGLYYKAVEVEKDESGFLSKGSNKIVTNINIFNPATGQSRLLLKPDDKRMMNMFLFEHIYNHESIGFAGSGHSALIKNNSSIKKRPLRDKILIGINNEDKKLTEFWTTDKQGKNLSRLFDIPYTTDWHIDVKNSMLRIIHNEKNQLRIESHKW